MSNRRATKRRGGVQESYRLGSGGGMASRLLRRDSRARFESECYERSPRIPRGVGIVGVGASAALAAALCVRWRLFVTILMAMRLFASDAPYSGIVFNSLVALRAFATLTANIGVEI